ncbi:MAG TPA: hypothetical protein GXX39_11625 [Syntrophothermus lipocalidus]|nr:hypothetical protein [Syntrophothermus lipocalidus]
MAKELEELILTREAKIAIIGLGYVGLPLAMEFCTAGYNVVGFDTDKQRVEALREGKSCVLDVPSEIVAVAVREGRFKAFTEFDHLQDVDAVSICVPTLLRKIKTRMYPNYLLLPETNSKNTSTGR